METHDGSLTIRITERELDRIAAKVQRFYQTETGRKYPFSLIVRALRGWLVKRVDALTEDLSEVLVSKRRDEAREFKHMLDESFEASRILAALPEEEERESSVFTGLRPFSMEKLGAMALYIAEHGKDIYKTKLNKLLFYSDFVNFYLHGRSISGATYVHVPFGPVPKQYGQVLAELSEARRLKLMPVGHKAILIKPVAKTSARDQLEREEIATIDWVLRTHGELSAEQIVELTHNEKAYRFTRPGEEIAYRYAAFFESLPDKKG
jgi:uncharacterized phage-associated protein